ncbi:MAG TPA: hypothetical protein PK200_02725 [Spirochaetota bacterium]|nr:hypothetical protein [Spirochaetota bacterium]HQP47322.1 hypothetical protein [Spirochaetota bacterium]
MIILNAVVYIHNWGDKTELIKVLKYNNHVSSLFHIMGRFSYLLDVNFDNKDQFENWIDHIKNLKLSSGVPSVISVETQKIIEVIKKKDDFDLGDYKSAAEKSHFFVSIDNPHHDQKLISTLKSSGITQTLLHIQGSSSYITEVISENYEEYRKLLMELKNLTSISHIETQEVISVIKYRNKILDESGNLVAPGEDTRELYSL